MAFLGQDPARCKIIVDNVREEFYIFSCEMSCENEKDFDKYYQNFLKYWEFKATLSNHLWSRNLKKQVCNLLAVPVLLYGIGIWTLR